MNRLRVIPTFAAIGLALASAAHGDVSERVKDDFRRPSSIPENAANPLTDASVELGKDLFFDPRISGSGILSCASCHNPSLDWEDNLTKGIGHAHQELGRSTPTILNAAWNSSHFWDGRAETLEEQALGPIESAVEMNMDLEEMIAVLKAIPGYAEKFDRAYPSEGISKTSVAKAIANFERTIVSGEAPFDRWIEGDPNAISESAKRGFELFNAKASCVKCHSGWNFTDGSFHDIGVATDDKGRGGFLGFDFLNHTFKTPTLRNASGRAPYMHNGSETTLREVVELYNMGGRTKRPTLSADIKPLGLTEREIDDLIEFLGTLTGEPISIAMPKLPTAESRTDTKK